jgi:hypothetical protein
VNKKGQRRIAPCAHTAVVSPGLDSQAANAAHDLRPAHGASGCSTIVLAMADNNVVRQFRYRDRLRACSDQPCPCERYRPRERVGYRQVHEPLQHDDFHPPAVKPGRPPSRKCSAHAVSFYTTPKAVRKSIERAKANYDVDTRYGTRIVAVTVRPHDGLCSKPSQKHKHFDLHEYDHDHGWESRIEGSFPMKEEET